MTIDRAVRELAETGCILWLWFDDKIYSAEAFNPSTGNCYRMGTGNSAAEAINKLLQELKQRPIFLMDK